MNEDDQKVLQEKFGTCSKSKRKRKGREMKNESVSAKKPKAEDSTSETFDEHEEKHLRKVNIYFKFLKNALFLFFRNKANSYGLIKIV